jgi:hypothetical protein
MQAIKYVPVPALIDLPGNSIAMLIIKHMVSGQPTLPMK